MSKTKKSLVFSCLSMLLCVSMLVGATFAWFTDNASTSVNSIQSGTLDVTLVDANGTSLEGETLNFIDQDDNDLWEPGCTYILQDVYVKNNGNLAIKYKVAITGIDGDVELNEAIDWTIQLNGEPIDDEYALAAGETSEALTISGHMKEDAGNQYQGLRIEGIAITVYATQDTVESDSFNNTYDANASLPEVKTAKDAATLATALTGIETAGNKNVAVNFTQDAENTTGVKTAAGNTLTMDFGGNDVTVAETVGSSGTTTNGMQLLKGSTVTLKNGTYAAAGANTKILIQNYSNLTLDDVTLDMTNGNQAPNNSFVLSANCGDILITGNTNIKGAEVALDIMHWHGASYGAAGVHVLIDEHMTGTVDGAINVYCYGSGETGTEPGATLVIKGGTFKNTGLTLDQFKSYVADGYTVIVNGDGSWTVSA